MGTSVAARAVWLLHADAVKHWRGSRDAIDRRCNLVAMDFPSLTPELEAIMQAEIAKNPTLEELLKKHAQNVAGLRDLLEEIMRINRDKKALANVL